jgi:biopolymer transport protein ExbB/TolQ
MDIQQFMKIMMANMPFIVIGLGVIILIMWGILINQAMKLSYMKKRYRKMMAGVDGANIERMLMGHIDEVKKVVERNEQIDAENQRIDALLQTAITRVGVVRFRAFDDMGSDLSYAVALLDSHNNGVILSSIFGREDSRSYVKPIENGNSSYTMTEEEEKALNDAMSKG